MLLDHFSPYSIRCKPLNNSADHTASSSSGCSCPGQSSILNGTTLNRNTEHIIPEMREDYDSAHQPSYVNLPLPEEVSVGTEDSVAISIQLSEDDRSCSQQETKRGIHKESEATRRFQQKFLIDEVHDKLVPENIKSIVSTYQQDGVAASCYRGERSKNAKVISSVIWPMIMREYIRSREIENDFEDFIKSLKCERRARFFTEKVEFELREAQTEWHMSRSNARAGSFSSNVRGGITSSQRIQRRQTRINKRVPRS